MTDITMEQDHIGDEKLSMFFDDELGPGETKIVQRHLDACATCTAKVKKLERLHSLIEEVSLESPAKQGLERDILFGKIEKGIAHDKGGAFSEGLRVWTTETMQHRKRVWVPTVIGTGLAIAAAALLAFGTFDDAKDDPEIARTRVRRLPEAIAAVQPAVQAALGSEIEEVDFGSNAGTVFAVQGDEGASYSVVWINDDDGGGP